MNHYDVQVRLENGEVKWLEIFATFSDKLLQYAIDEVGPCSIITYEIREYVD